jgi:hypothetical protein
MLNSARASSVIPKQLERFIALYDGDTRAAIRAVNTEVHDPTACGLVTTAYVRGPQLATARNKDATFIVQILVLGIADEEGAWNRSPPPSYTRCFRCRAPWRS